MKKIGFIDNFLSEWHANNYPDMIRNNKKAQELGLEVCYAYAKSNVSPYDGVTTDEWCKAHNVEKCNTIEEVVEKSDYIVVLSPDNPEMHYELAEAAIKSGKLTYIDKTFATSKEEAKKIFSLAKECGTPVYSSSSLRFADELKTYRCGDIPAKTCICVGCYKFDIYAIHIFEMICTVMKSGAKKIMAVDNSRNRNLIIDYGDNRYATYVQMDTDDPYGVPFIASIEMPDGSAHYYTIQDGYQQRFIDAMIEFFETGKPQVDCNETIDLMGMLDAARAAMNNPFTWIEIK